jgi:hypothetical protein
MGLYDERCTVSGVSLKASRVRLVLLGRTGVAHYPIALPLEGSYNRLGAIDVEEDDNAKLIFQYFLSRFTAGGLVLDAGYEDGMTDLQSLLGVFERNVTQHEDAALLDGRRVLFAMIDNDVWEAAVSAGKAGAKGDRFRRLFLDVPVADAIYQGSLGAVEGPLKQLAAVCDFLNGRGLAWRVRTEGGAQHYGDEMRGFLSEARRTFADCPPMLRGLERYEETVGEFLEDD